MICSSEEQDLVDFLCRALGPQSHDLRRVPGGGNNRLYRVQAGPIDLALKSYFHHPRETRDRLQAEFAFVSFAWRRGLRWVPRPVACDLRKRLALYEFIDGHRLDDASATHVAQAMDFFRELNAHKRHPTAARLPLGAEACFTLADHLRCVERRVERLLTVDAREPIDHDAAQFIAHELAPAWRETEHEARQTAARQGLSLDEPIAEDDRCLSPSDFGFHNALATSDGRMRFLDFEYAGWDDPAKLVCDFFCQPAVPAPPECYEQVEQAALEFVGDRALHAARFQLLMPVYRLKWCCIVLNEFLPVDHQRRQFAGQIDAPSRKQRQLEKARTALVQCAA